MMADILKIVANPAAAAPDLRSVAQCLRNLADTIDRGECGEVLRAAVDRHIAGIADSYREAIAATLGPFTPAELVLMNEAGRLAKIVTIA